MQLACISRWRRAAMFLGLLLLAAAPARAQEAPYFVTYDHHLEDPGDLELSLFSTVGVPRAGQPAFWAPYFEAEYGVTAWWTSELYLEGQARAGDQAIFTGWRLESRLRPLTREHRVNPILYVEYESLNEGSRIHKEVVGNSQPFEERNEALAREHAHEVEAKLILSSQAHGWNISENLIAEKNLSENEGVEFGYALGISRPLGAPASASDCRFCRGNFAAGLELYGGLGSTRGFGFHDTAHYLAPVVAWQVGEHTSLHFSPAFGLTRGSEPVLLRFGVSYELEDFGERVKAMFRKSSTTKDTKEH